MLAPLGIFLALYNNLVNLLPQGLHDQLYVPMNLSIGLLLVLWARRCPLSWHDLVYPVGHYHPAPFGAYSWASACRHLHSPCNFYKGNDSTECYTGT